MSRNASASRKPIVRGGWNGASAWALAGRCCLSNLLLAVLLFLLPMLLPLTAAWMQILFCIVAEALAFYLRFRNGMGKGERDCAWGESVYLRQQRGENVSPGEIDRSYHPAKGLFAGIIGVLPFFIPCLILSIIAHRVNYSLYALPGWMDDLMVQSEFADGLSYYTVQTSAGCEGVVRIIVRNILLPFFLAFSDFGNDALLLAERLSPLVILVVPMGYALGYANGQKARDAVNESIQAGVAKKMRIQQKEHRKRMSQFKKPEQLN